MSSKVESDPCVCLCRVLWQYVKDWDQHSDEVLGLAISPNGAYIASASRDASVRIYSYPELDELGAVDRFSDSVCALSFGPSSTFLAAAGAENCVKIIR